MIALVRAEWWKVRSTRLWVGLSLGGLGLTAAGTLLLLSILNTEQGRQAGLHPIQTAEDLRTLVFSASGAFAFVLVLAATMATSEYRYGTAAGTYLATPDRTRVVTAKTLAAVPIGFAYGVAAASLSLLLAIIWLSATGDVRPLGLPVGLAVLQVGLDCAYGAALAVGIGLALRSQLVSILGLLGWLFVIEPLASALLPDVARYTPFGGAEGLFGATTDTDVTLLSRPASAALVIAYLVGVWLAAVWLERRRDV